MGILTQLAQEAEQAVHLKREFVKLLVLVMEIQAGRVNPASVRVDLLNESWSLQRPVLVSVSDEEVVENGRF